MNFDDPIGDDRKSTCIVYGRTICSAVGKSGGGGGVAFMQAPIHPQIPSLDLSLTPSIGTILDICNVSHVHWSLAN